GCCLKTVIISAVAKNGVIGKSNGEMPWKVKEEFQHFKNTTMGFPIIMGRKTFDSLKTPLKGRDHLVISRNKNLSYPFEEVKIFSSIKEAIKYCEEKKEEKVFIIGGGEIYKQSVEKADELLISFMNFEANGDVYFPEIDKKKWKEKSRKKRSEFDVVTYVRK
ncbi:MAG: dihydrofolate reductase, partial [Ignavibacteriaceae bacterium]